MESDVRVDAVHFLAGCCKVLFYVLGLCLGPVFLR